MDFWFRRAYVGPLQAAIFDWAGTTVDYGCFAPVVVFREVFEQQGVPLTMEQARVPMGLEKKDHIRTIAAMEPVAEAWQAVHGRPWDEADIEALYRAFIPLQLACLAEYADLIPGTVEAVADCRQRGMKIGSTTGYNTAMMEVLLPLAAQRGYAPDSYVCPSTVPTGRPAPWMCLQSAMNLRVYPMNAIVKVGDTLPDIDEGLNAGMWTVGVTKTGNELGLSAGDVAALEPQQLAARLHDITMRMSRAGAHYVIESITDLPPVLDELNRRLRAGEQP
ncbi:MAG: phosphonoacetaldehyde hydrolase [Herpetosiphonaceae bacterium]|nr:phosphonoacetaldehyde hydrolase [Herpetosiphonaceae bacterium]